MNHNKTFVLPSVGNEISKLDIHKDQIRITADFNVYFPNQSGKVKVVIGEEYTCTFTHRGNRSHILRLGRCAAEELGLEAGKSVRFRKMDDKTFKLEKI